MQRAVLLPRDNKFTDSEGKILPQWRAVLERLEPLSRLTGTEIDRLVNLLRDLTEGDNPIITADGELNVTTPELNIQLEMLENGTSETVQSSATGLSLDFRRGMEFSAPNLVGVPWAPKVSQSLACAPFNVLTTSGSVFPIGGDAFALPVWIEDSYSFRYQGPMTTTGGSGGTRSCAIYRDNNGDIGESVIVYPATGYGIVNGAPGFDWGQTITLPRGMYWIAFSITGVAMAWLAVGTALSFHGVKLGSSATTPSWGLWKTGTSGILTANETGWVPSQTTSFPFLYLTP